MALTYDHAAAAVVYAATNTFSWAQQLLVPGIQAAANILLLERQRGLYEEIASDQRKLIDLALQNYLTRLDQILPMVKSAMPDIPENADYVPVNPCQEQGCTIECNISHIERADVWAQCINRHHEENDIARAVALDPRYVANIDMFSLSVQDLLRGKLSASDVMEVMTDVSETAALQGRIGGCRNLTSRNLGLSRMRAQAEGRKSMQEMMGMLNRDVSPVSRQADIRQMMVTPQQRIALALTQAQLIQNSLQNYFDKQAQKPPYLMAELQLQLQSLTTRLQAEASKASMVNGFVPDYATALQPQMNAVAGAFEKSRIAKGVQEYYDKYGPSVNQSVSDSPSVGGNYQQQNNADAKSGLR